MGRPVVAGAHAAGERLWSGAAVTDKYPKKSMVQIDYYPEDPESTDNWVLTNDNKLKLAKKGQCE